MFQRAAAEVIEEEEAARARRGPLFTDESKLIHGPFAFKLFSRGQLEAGRGRHLWRDSLRCICNHT